MAAITNAIETAGPALVAATLRGQREDAGADHDGDAEDRQIPGGEGAL